MRTHIFLPVLSIMLLCAIGAVPVMAGPPFSMEPTPEWQLLLGGNSEEYGSFLQPTADGGYILLGHSYSSANGDVAGTNHGGADLWVVKLSSARTIQWQRLLGGSGSEVANGLQPTQDGGYILLASSYSSVSGDMTGTNHGGADLWIVKLNSAGTIQWQRLLGGSDDEYGSSLQTTADGGYLLLSESLSSASGDVDGTNHGDRDLWVVKLNGAGDIQWQRLLGGSNYEYGSSLRPTADGGSILLSESLSSASGDVDGTNHGYRDLWVVKLNGAGGIQWQQLLGGSNYEFGRSIQQTPDGYILLGASGSSASGDVASTNHGGTDLWVAKLSSWGTIQWQQLLGGADMDYGFSLELTADGGYIALGRSRSSASGDVAGTNHGGNDLWVVKMNAGGALQGQRLFGGNDGEEPSQIVASADGGYVFIGSTYSSANGDVTSMNHGLEDIWLVKLRVAPTIRLSPGWNFISTPAVLAPGTDTASIFVGVDTAGHSIFLYNASSETWTPMTPSTKLKVLDGIWIYSKFAAAVPLSFDTNPLTVPPVKSLAAGWNAVGYSSLRPAYAHDALSSVTAKWSTLIGFNEVSQRYETSIFNGGSGDYSDYREAAPPKGYWLFMREPGQLSAVGAGP